MKSQTRPRSRRDSFLQTLDARIEEHLSDSTLSIQRLLRLVGMSRTDLHRKLDRWVGMSSTEYLRRKRLEKAAELLREEPEWSVCQVADEVGFEHQGYFSKRFKEVFGCCPAEWRGRLAA